MKLYLMSMVEGSSVMNWFSILNFIIMLGIIITGVIIYFIDEMLPCIIAMAVLGTFVALEFLVLGAPDVAIAEGAVGAILTPLIFIVTLKKVGGDKK